MPSNLKYVILSLILRITTMVRPSFYVLEYVKVYSVKPIVVEKN